MGELMQFGAGAAAGMVAPVVALLPRRWPPATILAGLFVPLLISCAAMMGFRVAFGGLSGETGNAVGELDLWLLGLAFCDTAAALLCLGRVLAWVKDIAAPYFSKGHAP